MRTLSKSIQRRLPDDHVMGRQEAAEHRHALVLQFVDAEFRPVCNRINAIACWLLSKTQTDCNIISETETESVRESVNSVHDVGGRAPARQSGRRVLSVQRAATQLFPSAAPPPAR